MSITTNSSSIKPLIASTVDILMPHNSFNSNSTFRHTKPTPKFPSNLQIAISQCLIYCRESHIHSVPILPFDSFESEEHFSISHSPDKSSKESLKEEACLPQGSTNHHRKPLLINYEFLPLKFETEETAAIVVEAIE